MPKSTRNKATSVDEIKQGLDKAGILSEAKLRKYVRKPKQVVFVESKEAEGSEGSKDIVDTEGTVDIVDIEDTLKSALRPGFRRVDLLIYTEENTSDDVTYFKEFQDICTKNKIGTQFVVYADQFDNSKGITNLYRSDSRCEPFWSMTLGSVGSKALFIKERPRLDPNALCELVKSNRTYTDNFLRLLTL